MDWRAITVDEIETCLTIAPRAIGDELVGRARAVAAWQSVLRSGALTCAAVVHDDGRIIGFGGAVFVSEDFVHDELRAPAPGLNARIVASVDAGRPVVLGERDVAAANAGDGLSVVFVDASVRPDLPLSVRAQAEGQIATACFHTLNGYRLRRALREAVSAEALESIRSQRIFATIDPLDRFFRLHPDSGWNRDRALAVADREDCLAVPGSIAAILFSYREPVLGLTRHHQQLLAAALRGLTDDELARSLGLKLPAVKKRWVSVFEHIVRAKPSILPGGADGGEREGRGPQKRHRVLAYLRDHPEELRPHDGAIVRVGARQADSAGWPPGRLDVGQPGGSVVVRVRNR
jgi:hypothetical protein